MQMHKNNRQLFLFSAIEVPVISPFHFPKKVDMKQRVIVHCSVVSGDPPFTFRWLKDGHDIQQSDRLTIKVVDEFTSTLTIYKLVAESVGNYTCRVSNSVGSDEKHGVLIIEGMKYNFYSSCGTSSIMHVPYELTAMMQLKNT